MWFYTVHSEVECLMVYIFHFSQLTCFVYKIFVICWIVWISFPKLKQFFRWEFMFDLSGFGYLLADSVRLFVAGSLAVV